MLIEDEQQQLSTQLPDPQAEIAEPAPDKSSPSSNQDDTTSEKQSSTKKKRRKKKKKKEPKRNVKTIAEEELGEIKEKEKALMEQDWSAFKTDVSMKTLINQLDKAIKRRMRLYISDDEVEKERIASFRKQYYRYKPLKMIAMTLYILLPFFEKPGWCIHNSDIDVNTTEGEWYCQNKDGAIANSHIPKLPAVATNSVYIACLITMFIFTKARDMYRRRDLKGDTVTLQLWLCAIAIIDLIIVITVISVDIPQETRDNHKILQFFKYPYINAFIRPVLFTFTIRSVKSFWRRYILVIKGSAPMVAFIVIYVFYFAWMGSRLFAGTIEGVETFSNLNDSFFYMFVLLTTSNYPDVMLPSYGQQRRFAAFFITYLVIGLFLLMNLLLAIFYSAYQERVDKSIDDFKERRNAFLIKMFRKYDKEDKQELGKEDVFEITKEFHSLVNGLDEKSEEIDMTQMQFEQVFALLNQDQDEKDHMEPKEMVDLLQAYETWLYEKQYKSAMEDLYSDNQVDSIQGDHLNIWQKALRFMSGPKYELFMNIITILNIFTVFIRVLWQTQTEAAVKGWIILELSINLLMLTETIGDIAISGPVKAYRYHFRIWPETMCQILNIPAMIKFFDAEDFAEYNYTVKIFEVIVFIRMLKLLTLLYEVKVMRVIFETLKNLLGPLNNLIIVMMTIFYVFAQLGMVIFGGKIKQNSPEIVQDSSIPDNYYLINFNDLMSSYVTLFILIVVNNWYVIVQMCVDIMGGNTAWRYFFIVFYYFGVIIGLNIIIAFAIDMYAAVQRLEEQQEANRLYLVRLAEDQHKVHFNQNNVDDEDEDEKSNLNKSPAVSPNNNLLRV